MGETLLLTGTIAPNKEIKNKFQYLNSLDPNRRLEEYLECIRYYLKESDFESIVFCENSNYQFLQQKKSIYNFAKNLNKKIEILQFLGNTKKTLELGYSYGEGECIDYAFIHSRLLHDTNSRYKITGRYKILNINELIKYSVKYDNLLFKWMRPLGFFDIDTSFFKVNNNIYEKYLYDAKSKITKENKKCIEALFYDCLRGKKIEFGKLKKLPEKDGYRLDIINIDTMNYY